MKKQLSGGAVTGILVVVGLIVAVLAWKFVLAPPSAPTPVTITKEMLKDREKTMNNIKDDQMRRAAAAAGGTH